MKYFEFKYIETKNEKIVNQGDALYYTSAEQNIDEMKKVVKGILKNSSAVISIPLITEIDLGIFIQKGGNPNIH
jgi:hypothetical protein